VLGSSFAESVDLLGGRISHAMVVGPALPEVNAVQQARIRECRAPDRAFRQVYQIPGMNKVDQALGRLVRAPGHRTSVLLHCQRFADTEYRGLLAPNIATAKRSQPTPNSPRGSKKRKFAPIETPRRNETPLSALGRKQISPQGVITSLTFPPY
jgi:Rad3-related DNA helicase